MPGHTVCLCVSVCVRMSIVCRRVEKISRPALPVSGVSAACAAVACAAATGYGPKYRGARRKPHTRGPHAAETSSMLGTRPQLVGVFLLRWPQHHAARSTCAASSNVRSSPLGANTVCKSRNSFAERAVNDAQPQPNICSLKKDAPKKIAAVRYKVEWGLEYSLDRQVGATFKAP